MPQDAGPRVSAQTCVVLAALLIGSALCWLALYRLPMNGMAGTVTMGLSLAPFMRIWIVMMAAMMFPAAAPMILAFQKVQSRRAAGGAAATVLFVAGYLSLWSLTGFGAYALARGAEAVGDYFAIPPDMSARIGGALVVAAGVYQLTPAKDLCLSQCRTPLTFIMTNWRAGATGAFAMGWLHGLYCFGCCWLLFATLFPLGMMNIAAMALITLLVSAEKALPRRWWGAVGSALLLIACGTAVLVAPRILPTYAGAPAMKMNNSDMGGMDMP